MNSQTRPEIKDISLKTELKPDGSEAEIRAEVTVESFASEIVKDYSLRLWIEGENSKSQPIEMVLIEHLYLLPEQERVASLHGTLFDPIVSTPDFLYWYKCRLELLDGEEKVVEVAREQFFL